MCVFEEVIPKVGFGISNCPLVEVSHGCKLVPVGCGSICLPLSESGFHKSSLFVDILVPPGFGAWVGF